MRNVAGSPVLGPVRICRHEDAEWDRELGAWQAPCGVTIVTFRPDGQMSEGESPRAQHTRFEYRYDEHGNWTERTSWNRTDPRMDFQLRHHAADDHVLRRRTARLTSNCITRP